MTSHTNQNEETSKCIWEIRKNKMVALNIQHLHLQFAGAASGSGSFAAAGACGSGFMSVWVVLQNWTTSQCMSRQNYFVLFFLKKI